MITIEEKMMKKVTLTLEDYEEKNLLDKKDYDLIIKYLKENKMKMR